MLELLTPSAIIITGFCLVLSLLFAWLLWDRERRYLIPGIFTAIGIGGTFVSLLANIVWYGKKLQDPAIAELFVAGFVSAFLTSLFGIILSIIAKAAISAAERREEEAMGEAEQQKEDRSERAYLHDILEQLKSSQSSQNELWKRQHTESQASLERIQNTILTMNLGMEALQDIFEQFAEKLVTDLNNELNPLIEKLGKEAFQRLSSSIKANQDSYSEESQKIVSRINEQLLGAISKLKTETNLQTQQLANFYKDANSHIGNSHKALEKQTQGIEMHQKSQVEQMAAFYARLRQESQNIQQDFKKDLSNQALSFQGSIENYKKQTSESLADHFSDIDKILQRMETWQRENKQHIEGLNNSFNRSVLRFEKLAKQQGQNQEEIGGFEKSLSQLGQQLSSLIEANEHSLNRLNQQSKKIADINIVINKLGNIEGLLSQLDDYFKVPQN